MREEKTTYGVLRWDAWYPSTTPTDTGFQAARSLNPKKYHFRAPFFARINEEDRVVIPEYTQEIFDREMEYALDAGIDYFSYVWYDHPGLRLARDFHKKSKYRNDLTMCACIDGNAAMKDYAHEEIPKLFKESFYKTVFDGRPLVYYFSAPHLVERIKEDIAFYKEYCKNENIKAPYFVIMGVGADKAKEMGGDAISRYSISGSDNIPFRKLMENTYAIWERHSREGEAMGIDNVLPMTAGWHPHPRFEQPVSWMGVQENDYVQYATPEEIYEHYKDAQAFLKDEKNFESTKTNSTILYAWNEHDEGGWICPTLKVDENGNQVFDEKGEPMIDTSRIEAVKRAIKG